jgi:hypothetical protein
VINSWSTFFCYGDRYLYSNPEVNMYLLFMTNHLKSPKGEMHLWIKIFKRYKRLNIIMQITNERNT